MTEHELGDESIFIGRDPGCELFFADKKLSRRHAKVEPSGVGFKLVDLDSRNGAWVNEERVSERQLLDGDEVRLGGLKIYFESDTPELVLREDDADESTIYLSREPVAEADGTLALEGERASFTPPPQAPAVEDGTIRLSRETPIPDESATRALSPAEIEALDEADETLQRQQPIEEPTVVFSGEKKRASTDTGTVIFRSGVRPISPVTPKSAPLARSERSSTSTTFDAATRGRDVAAEPDPERSAPAPLGGAHALRLAALAAVAALFAVLVLAVPLMRTFGGALSEESQLRGRALAALLAAANESALGQGRLSDVTVRRVTEERGVTDAFVLDPMGRILAPRERAGEAVEIEALAVSPADVRSLQWGRSASGDLVVAEPVSYRGRRVGVAVVSLRTPSAGWPALVLLLASALLLMGLTTAVFLTRRWTLAPVRDLLQDVEALSGASAQEVSTERPFVELSALAESVNRILGKPPSPP